jgi:hypothetical protein
VDCVPVWAEQVRVMMGHWALLATQPKSADRLQPPDLPSLDLILRPRSLVGGGDALPRPIGGSASECIPLGHEVDIVLVQYFHVDCKLQYSRKWLLHIRQENRNIHISSEYRG